jgi:hypothetical protein
MAFQTLGKVFDHSWQLSCHSSLKPGVFVAGPPVKVSIAAALWGRKFVRVPTLTGVAVLNY